MLEIGCKIVCCPCQIEHDIAISTLSQPDQLVVLSDNLTRAARKIESEGSLIGAEVVDVEDEFLRQVGWISPDDPTDAWVYKAVLVARDIDGYHFR